MKKHINNTSPFWTEQISVLISRDQFYKIIPTSKMTRREQLNAITRMCIYLIILIYMFGYDNLLQLPVIVIIFVIILNYVFNADANGASKELLRQKTEQFHNESIRPNDYNNSGGDNDSDSEASKSYTIDTGTYDFDNNLVFERKLSKRDKDLNNLNYSLDELIEFNRAKCRKPTVANPFMNLTQGDFNKPNIPSACNGDDEDINNDIVDKFNKDLFMDVGDLFESKNSQRQFYTVPSSNPPDTIKFANALYKSPYGCESKQDGSLRFENLRHKV